jgi:hypothetical protein
MVFDVESIGLHGEGFAVAAVLVNLVPGKLEWLGEFYAATAPSKAAGDDSDRRWVAENVKLPQADGGVPLLTHFTLEGMREAFWSQWLAWRREYNALLAADCTWPVESNFLSACVRDAPADRGWDGPYPLVDIAMIRYAAGYDPTGTYPRDLPGAQEIHNPLHDARHSARQLYEAVERLHAAHEARVLSSMRSD